MSKDYILAKRYADNKIEEAFGAITADNIPTDEEGITTQDKFDAVDLELGQKASKLALPASGCLLQSDETGNIQSSGYLTTSLAKQWGIIENDFMRGNVDTDNFASAAVNGGTITTTTSEDKHPGVILYTSHASNANSGGRFGAGVRVLPTVGDGYSLVFKTAATLTGITRRIGFLDVLDTTTPANGMYFLMSGSSLIGRVVSSSTATETTSHTLLANTWYRLVMEIGQDRESVNFVLYADNDASILWSATVTTNIPPLQLLYCNEIVYLASPSGATALGLTDYIALYLHGQRRLTPADESSEDYATRDLVLEFGISPKAYGAIGNANYFNSTDKNWYVDAGYTTIAHDDTTAFRNALTAASGKTLHVSKGSGSYYLVDYLSIPSNTTVLLEDNVKLAIKSYAINGLRMSSKNKVNIIGKGNSEIRMYKQPNEVSPQQHAIYIIGSTNIWVEGLTIYTADGDGIDIGGGSVDPINTNITIKNCKIYESKRNNISITQAQNVFIEDCVLNDCHDRMPQGGIDIEPNVDCVAKDILVRNCTASNNLGKGFYVTYQSENVTFDRCRAYSDGDGFLVSGIDANKYAVNIKFLNCEANDCTGEGFSTDKAKDVWHENCLADTCSNGFAFYSKSKGGTFINCKAIRNRGIGFYVRDLSADHTTEDVIVKGCVAESNGSAGISVQNSKNVAIEECRSLLNTVDGIYITNATDSRIARCHASDNLGVGIYDFTNKDTSGGGNLTLRDNIVLRNKRCGILIYDSARTILRGNEARDNGAYSDSTYKANIRIQDGTGISVVNNTVRTINSNGVNIVGLSINQYGTVTNTYVKDNDCYLGGSGSGQGLLLVSGDANNNLNAGNRNKDGTYSTTAN